MQSTRFETYCDLEDQAADLVTRHLQRADLLAHGLVLAGGRTPLRLYRRLAAEGVTADKGAHVILSDERYVPENSPEHNFGSMRVMIRSLGIPASRIIRPHTDLPIEEATRQFDGALAAFLRRGTIALALLGLGADGHTASLFRAEDVRRGERCYALSSSRTKGPADRISVTRGLLLRAERVVFLVAGEEKTDAVCALLATPETIAAGQAMKGIANVEVWHTTRR